MKKIILAAAIVISTGVLALMTNTDVKTGKVVKVTATSFEKNVTATAD